MLFRFARGFFRAQIGGFVEQIDKFVHRAVFVFFNGSGKGDDVLPAHFAVVLAAVQLLPVGGRGNGKARGGRGLGEGLALRGDGLLQQDAVFAVGVFIAQFHECVFFQAARTG